MDSHQTFHALQVKEVRPETAEAVTLVFDIPENLRETFAYQAGQYLTLQVTVKGKEARRAYSMSSAPLQKEVAITVKRVKNGLVSNYLNDQVKPGQVLDVLPPNGRFTPKLDADQRIDYYLFGAGSGITPLISIARTILEEEPKSAVYLLYGSRNEESILFRGALEEMERRYEGQFVVAHTLSQPKREKPKGLGGLFAKGQLTWEGKVGRIDGAMAETFLQEYPNKAGSAVYMLCGPGGMIESVESVLRQRGIPENRIHAEYFANDGATSGADTGAVQAAQVRVHLSGKVHEVQVPLGKTILDVLVEQKLNPPYSCSSGACSTCMARVLSGSMQMDVCHALDDDEIARGYVLSCQARPTSAEVELAFE